MRERTGKDGKGNKALSQRTAQYITSPLTQNNVIDRVSKARVGNLDNIWDNSKSTVDVEWFQGEYSPTKSMRLCNRCTIPTQSPELRFNPKTGKARFTGLMSCDNPLCVHCYSRVRKDAVESTARALTAARNENWEGMFLTLTLPKMAVETQLVVLNKCFNNITVNIRNWCKNRGIAFAYTFGLDFTVNPSKSYDAQIHSHIHTPFLFSKLNDNQKIEIKNKIIGWWIKSVMKTTGKAPVASAQDIRPIIDWDSDVAAYTMKINAVKTAREAIDGVKKSSAYGYGWLEFVELCAASLNPKLIAIYQRIVAAFKGKKFFRLNKTMKELAEVEIEEEKHDEVEEVVVKMSKNLFIAVQELDLKQLWLSVFADYNKTGNNRSLYELIIAYCDESMRKQDDISVNEWIDNLMSMKTTDNIELVH